MQAFIETLQALAGEANGEKGYAPDTLWDLTTPEILRLCGQFSPAKMAVALRMTRRFERAPIRSLQSLLVRVDNDRLMVIIFHVLRALEASQEIHGPEDTNPADTGGSL